MIGQMAIAIALPGFNDLGRSITPIFLLMDFCLLLTDHFLYQFSTFSEKKIEIYGLEVLFANCTIEFRCFYLFDNLCGFKCLLKG